MNRNDKEANLEARAALFKALGHPVRLLIMNLVEIQPRHGQELAEILNLNPATISHHLGKLAEVGLLKSRKDQYYQTYELVEHALDKSMREMVFFPQPGLDERVQQDAYREKVLKAFFKHGRLVQIPAQLKKRQIILEVILEEFEPERRYSEIEVNRILVEYHEDVATLRRSLISHGYMQRDKGFYWRVA